MSWQGLRKPSELTHPVDEWFKASNRVEVIETEEKADQKRNDVSGGLIEPPK